MELNPASLRLREAGLLRCLQSDDDRVLYIPQVYRGEAGSGYMEDVPPALLTKDTANPKERHEKIVSPEILALTLGSRENGMLSKPITNDTWPAEQEDNITDLAAWMHRLNKQGYFTGAVRHNKYSTTMRSFRRYSECLRIRCVEFNRASNCRATVVAKKRKETGRWLIEYVGTHNHNRLKPEQKSNRNYNTLLDLKNYSSDVP